VYWHPVEDFPADAERPERVPLRSCVRRGPRGDRPGTGSGGGSTARNLCSPLARGRELVFWQSPRTFKQSRPGYQEARSLSRAS
jgi:hypothetical protein